MSLEDIMLSEISQKQKEWILYDSMYENPRAVKFIKTDSRILVARDWSERDGELRLLGTEFQFYMTGNILEIGCKKVWMHLTLNCPLKNCSIQVSHLVVSDSLWPHRLQHTRLPCSSSTPGACSNSRPSSQWCHLTISSAAIPFSSRLQSFPASGSFQMSQFFTSWGQSIGVSASASVLPMNIQDWFLFRLTGMISLLSKGLSRVFSNTTVQKHQFFGAQSSLWSNSHICTWLLKKP